MLYLDRKQYCPDPGGLGYADPFGTGCRFRYRVLAAGERWSIESPA